MMETLTRVIVNGCSWEFYTIAVCCLNFITGVWVGQWGMRTFMDVVWSKNGVGSRESRVDGRVREGVLPPLTRGGVWERKAIGNSSKLRVGTHPCSRVVCTGSVNTARQHGCPKWHPCRTAVSTVRQHGPVNTSNVYRPYQKASVEWAALYLTNPSHSSLQGPRSHGV